MIKIVFTTLLFLLCQFKLQAQFMVDTLNTVEITGKRTIEITGKRTIKKVSFSTFTSKISLSGSHFGFTTMEKDTTIKERILPIGIQIQNTKGVKVRLDSMYVKSTPFDTTKTSVILNIYSDKKLFNSAKIKLQKVDGKVSTIYFDTPIYLGKDISYIGFTIIPKDNSNFPFTFYTNSKIEGYLYSYNKERDEFKLLDLAICHGLHAHKYNCIILEWNNTQSYFGGPAYQGNGVAQNVQRRFFNRKYRGIKPV